MAELLTSDSRVWCQTLFEPRDTCWNLRHLFRSSALVTFERTVRKKPAGWAFWAYGHGSSTEPVASRVTSSVEKMSRGRRHLTLRIPFASLE